MRSKAFLTADLQCSALASVFDQSGFIYPYKLKKKNLKRLNFVLINEQLNVDIQIMYQSLKLANSQVI
jgi:hypothetical protein